MGKHAASVDLQKTPWLHEGHKPVQHRDRQPPWCEMCGYTDPKPAVEAKKIKDKP